MKVFKSVSVALVLLFGISSAGCSSGDSDTPSGTVVVTGTVNTGTIAMTASNAIMKAAAAASGYSVVAIDNARNKTYQATTDANGDFSLSVPPDTTYLIGLVSDGSYVGPVVFDGTGTQVNTAIKPASDTSLGSITVDAAEGYARTEAAPAIVDATVLAEAANSKPKGAGPNNDGKVQNSGITNRDDSDEDKDGIPNLFDADEDNDGIRNGILSRPSSAAVVSSHIDQVYMTSNIWKEHGTPTTGSTQAEIAANEIALRLHVVPIAGHESVISSVACTGVPSSIASVATVRWADSLGSPSGYPAEGSLWSPTYGLYRTTDTVQFPQEEWIVSIKPVGVMSVGDTFTIRVTYTDATTEDFYVVMPYVLIDWSKISTYGGTTLTDAVGTKTAGSQAPYAATPVTIVFTKPLDEDGNILAGPTYSIRYAESDCSTGTCTVPSTVTEPSVTDTGATTLTVDVPIPTIGTTYYITPVAEMNSQRNGEETWFIRQ